MAERGQWLYRNPATLKFPAMDRSCTCPYGIRSLGHFNGITMGQGRVRLSTTPGCPEHNSCHGWTAKRRKTQPRWSKPYCPIHGTKDCPDL